MISSIAELQEIFEIAPEWQAVLSSMQTEIGQKSSTGKSGSRLAIVSELLNKLGAKSLYAKSLSLDSASRAKFLTLLRNHYFQPLLLKMLQANQNLRRFWAQRRVEPGQQKDFALSLSIDLAQKLEGSLTKHLQETSEDGFKVLLPAYVQRSVHNAVVDYIRQEWSWEKHTLQDLSLDPEQDDPRSAVADDTKAMPEQMLLSGEQVGQLNKLRRQLEVMLKDPQVNMDSINVVDCMFGLGLTKNSRLGEEMTMRECCDVLNIPGETPARRIARCQVLLDKGLDMVRQAVREKLPDIVESWQGELNVNKASRRELGQQLGLTEGEVERLIKFRQYLRLEQLIDRGVIKPQRLPEIKERGASAAFVMVDINSSTTRDLIDILGLDKELAQTLVAKRPFEDLHHLQNNLVQGIYDQLIARGGFVRASNGLVKRIDLNRVETHEFEEMGISQVVAKQLVRGRPFYSWAELEEFLGEELGCWNILREKFCLGLSSG